MHNLELKVGKGGQLARSAGAAVEVVAKEGEYVTVRLRSTEMRMIHGNCLATIGTVGNAEHELLSWGKAGKTRWMGRRPKVRGEVMNPVDHPHGGRTRGGPQRREPVGQEGRRQDAQHQEAVAALDRPRPQARQSHAISCSGNHRRSKHSRLMARSLKKGPYIHDSLLKKVAAMNTGTRSVWSRPGRARARCIPDFVGHTFAVHNGNKFIPVYVTENMVGHKLGEFSPTRLFRGHTGQGDR